MHLSRLCIMVALALAAATAGAQTRSAGTLTGKVVFAKSGAPIHKARILITEVGRSTETAEDGTFQFASLAPGQYHVVARLAGLSDVRTVVDIVAGDTATLEFELGFQPVRQQITVTASGQEETTFDTFQAVTTVESIDLVKRAKTSIGEVLDNEPGVAKRSFGPGSARPVLRGFDGDRVLIMQDGMSTGSLSSQSADHGEAIDVLELDRLEVVKGPATLLYGSGALGGVVNAV